MGGRSAFIFLWRRVGRVCNCFDIHERLRRGSINEFGIVFTREKNENTG